MIMKQKIAKGVKLNIVKKYDRKYDIMHIFITDGPYFYEEEHPGIYVARNDDTNSIEKFTVMDYQENKETFKKYYPEYASFVA